MSDRDAVQRANESFYRCLEGLDLEGMERLWAQEDWVRCIHPGWDVLVGWPAVRQSWETIFANTQWMRVVPTNVDVVLLGDVAVVSCAENMTATDGAEVGVAVAQATNLFRRLPTGWAMIHHHASAVPVQVTQPFSGHVQ